jgi:hypothetical protein
VSELDGGHPPDPQMKRGALAGTPNFISTTQPKKISAAEQNTQLETSEIQTRRVARLYAVSVATAATIANLAYAVGAP